MIGLAMDYVLIMVSAAIAFAIWYLVFGIECFINGAHYENDLLMPFEQLYQEFSFNLPGGWERKLKAYKGSTKHAAEWAAMYPGWGHILIMHLLFPCGVGFGFYHSVKFLNWIFQ